MRLTDLIPGTGAADPDALYEAFVEWAGGDGLTLYPHQDEAIIDILTGANTIVTTPTGSGKTLIATAAHFASLAAGGRSYYTAPIKALVSEKFFALCEIFGADQVGMVTGDAAVNPDAPIVCCTAEILANIALREGRGAAVDQVVVDEFHFIADPDRGWAWQVGLVELPQAQFVIMSATLGDVTDLARSLSARTGRATSVVGGAVRPVPLEYDWSVRPVHETIELLLRAGKAPVYIVHPTQAAAVERAQAMLSSGLV
ncbi:MAG: DEAD/DEAH box helicase, partial [Propionibacteriaceae bacterium]|nr:DEAD/DEAH box helicase [Propionibacteriaceae bacterium]